MMSVIQANDNTAQYGLYAGACAFFALARRYASTLSIGVFLFVVPAYGQEDKVFEKLEQKRFPEAESILSSVKTKSYFLFKAVLENAWNKPNQSLVTLGKYKPSDTGKFAHLFHFTQYDNYLKTFQYGKASKKVNTIIKEYSVFYDREELEELKQASLIWEALSQIPPQKVLKRGDTRLPILRDKAKLMNIPVRVGDSTYSFIFDTGAGLSTLSESCAARLGIQYPSQSTVIVKAFTGSENRVKIGVVPTLAIGNIQVHNAVFMVFPDSSLTFGNGIYKINGIIGLPVLKEFGSLTITKDTLMIPARASNHRGVKHNLALQEYTPVIYLSYSNHELPFVFDTGDNGYSFTKLFYQSFHQTVSGAVKTLQKQSAGGSLSYKALIVDTLEITINKQIKQLKKVTIDLDNFSGSGRYYFGNLGQGFLNQFQMFTLDFTNAFFRVY